ncbi:germination protein YpeB [Caminicella sporogenes]|uniref:germination protein YpeB n=1 Tax=Caminicella sporogenes TaxID=166485 RepID=UPI002540B537|nr:germination protein YpeB [Caminicella sporogenes]WIF94216.1 germination protein YpeB [Caminicella sporogenes]
MKNIFIGMFISTLIILILTFGWGYEQYQERNSYSIYIENQFQRMFYDLLGEVENIQSDLAKVMITGTPSQNVMIFTDLMYKAYNAQERLTQLPIKHKDVSKTQKFLSQVGDFSMAMARKCSRGIILTQDDMEIIEKLHNYSNYLSQSLIKIQNEFSNEKGLKISELIKKSKRKFDKMNENMINTSLVNVEERMQKYPELIYDGPFSEHIWKIKAKLKGKEINKEEAEKIALNVLSSRKKYSANIIGETENTKLPAYIIELRENKKRESSITMAITKKGGKLLWLLDTLPVGDEKISNKEAIKIAKNFLDRIGFKNMEATYSEEYDGQLVINFAYKDGNVLVYSDLIKVKVSMDDGSIKGFEAEGYLINHYKRNIPKPKITEKEAKNILSINSQIKKSRLVIIPTEGSKEILCYEFLVNYKKDSFLIYINAENGEEEKILQLIIKEHGILIM